MHSAGLEKNVATIAEVLRHKLRIETEGAVIQGMEKEVIILSVTLSRGGAFASDQQRLNVALTRARRHLILTGSAQAVLFLIFLKICILSSLLCQACRIHCISLALNQVYCADIFLM